MSPTTPERPDLTPEEERFVRRVADVYQSPPLSPARRVAFGRALEERVARAQRRRGGPALVAGAVVAASALLLFAVMRSPEGEPAPRVALGETAGAGATATPEEAILALATESVADRDASLPDDYAAIESLFLGG